MKLIMENWKKFLKEAEGLPHDAAGGPGLGASRRIEIQNERGQILVVHVEPNFVTLGGETHQRVKAIVDQNSAGGYACANAWGDGKTELDAILDAIKGCTWINLGAHDVQRALEAQSKAGGAKRAVEKSR
tara:strand:- start:517 stop:906 length:390 start_codon:yes stop_codon:yes gene_type:complete